MRGLDGPYRAAILALAEGRPLAALPLLEAAAESGDGGAFAWLNLGLALSQLGRLAEAVPALERAAAALPGHAEPRFRLGQIAGLRGETPRAAASFRAALARDPCHVPAIAALAATEEAAGRLLEASALIARARALDPAEPELAAWAARIALAREDAEAALREAEAVLAERPEHVAAAQILARALLRQHGREEALALVVARAAADPFAAAWPLAAATLHALTGDLAASLAELQAAAALAPEAPEVQGELGRALAAAGRGAEAEAALRLAIAGRPNDIGLRERLATVLCKAHRLGEAQALLDSAIADFGEDPALLMNRALLLNLRGEQAAALAEVDRAMAITGGSRDALIVRLSVLAYHQEADAAALLAAGRRIDACLGPAPAPLHAKPRDPERRLRVGLLSGNFSRHPVGWLTVAGIEALPEEAFDIAAYSLRLRDDPITHRFRACAGLWREVGATDDAAIARAIAGDGVDILIDLGGYGEGGRPFVLHHRPAPVQVKWVGSQASSTGLGCVDWMLTDRWETPAGFERFYTERLLRLPDGYVCYSPPPEAPPVAPLPALARGQVTFGCFNNLAKLTPAVLAAWARILAALPGARLVLRTQALGDEETRERMRQRLAAAGLPEARVELHGGLPHLAFLGSYGEIDIALDPFPYAGGLTVCEALWMGVPTVGLAGESFAGRHAASHLGNAGLPDWVAGSVDAYVALAVARARDLGALAALRAGLRDQVRASPLCDAPRFGRSLGAALHHAWRDWCARSE